MPGVIVWYVDEELERVRDFSRLCISGGSEKSKDEALLEERDSWIVKGCRKSRLWMWHGHHQRPT